MDICRRRFSALLAGAVSAPVWAASNRPKLTVLLLVEELRADALDSVFPQLATGGFRRLAARAAWFPTCRHLSSTFSATGIANLATGAWPAQHGIVADSWYDRPSRTTVRASTESLLATTLAAQAADDAAMRVAVVAMSRSHAALFAGTPHASLYFLDDAGHYAAAGPAPDWLAAFNAAHTPEQFNGANWMAVNAVAGAPPLRTLHVDDDHRSEFLAMYRASPFAQMAAFDLAAELLVRDKLGQGTTSDLLCIVDQSAALLGYAEGARSPLMNQMVLQLDRRIETLLDQLAGTVGENGFNLVVSAAHGAPPCPAPESRARMAVNGETVAQAVETALKGSGRHVEKYVYPFVYLDRAATLNTAEPIRRMAAEAALTQPPVAGFYTAGGACSTTGEWQRRFQNSFHPQRSGDVMLSYRPEYVEDTGAGRGISYGSLYNYDACVPLFLYGPQFRAAVFETPVDAVDLAPTLARALGIAEPSSAVGRVLSEALIA